VSRVQKVPLPVPESQDSGCWSAKAAPEKSVSDAMAAASVVASIFAQIMTNAFQV